VRILWQRLVATFRGEKLDAELDAEVGLHLEMLEERHRARGLSPGEARREARREFGGIAQTVETCRDRRGLPVLETLWQDLRHAFRALRGNPGFAAVAVVTLALGIGANTTIFSALNALVLRPLRLEDPDRLVFISETRPREGGRRGPSHRDAFQWKHHSRGFATVELGGFSADPANLTGLGRAERVTVAYCSTGYLAMLGVKPHRGRGFLPEDADNSAAVISANLWQRSFNGDPGILGKTIAIEGKPETILGILPPGFSIAPWDSPVDVWIAVKHDGAMDLRWLSVVGRLKPGVTIQQAEAELNGLAQSRPEPDRGWNVQLRTLHETLTGGIKEFFWVPFCAVGFVLLIACVNVANLLLARAAVRRKEIAIRVSLGAGRWRLVRLLLAESAVLALGGGVLGVLLAVAGGRALFSLIPLEDLPSVDMSPDFRVLGFALALSLLTGLLFGLAPAVRASRLGLNDCLKESGRQAASGFSQRGQAVLLVCETALAMVLLVGAGLLVNSLIRLERVDLGFNPRHVLRADIKLAGPKYVRQTQTIMKNVTPEGDFFFEHLLERLHAIPGVQAAGISHLAPPGDVQMRSFRIVGRPAPPPGKETYARFNEVGGAYFQSLEIPLRRGRFVNDRDAQGAPWVVNINETMAKRYFPNEDPLGKMVHVRILGGRTGVDPQEDQPRRIVGVVGDVRHFGPWGEPQPVMYGGYRQHVTAYPGGLYIGHLWKSITVRTAGAPLGIVAAIQKAAAEVDKDQPLFQIQTMDSALAGSLAGPRFLMRLFGIFAAVALGLAAVGIYGVMSYLVTRRTHEIGVRMALGARPSHVLRIVVGRGAAVASAGLAIGIAVSLALTRLIARMLFGVKTTDPLTYAAVSILLLLVALTACWLPARRALRVNPLVALRHE
jgi:putative ABC transport system permease protein